MHTYALIVTIAAWAAACAVFAFRREWFYPAVAMIVASLAVRLSEYLNDSAFVMLLACTVCIFLSLQGKGKMCKAIATIYLIRGSIFLMFPIVFTGPNQILGMASQFAPIDPWFSMWELSNGLVILQAMMLGIGAIDNGMGKPLTATWNRARSVGFSLHRDRGLFNVSQRRSNK